MASGKKGWRWRRWIFFAALFGFGWWVFRGGAPSVKIEDGSFLYVDIEGLYEERASEDVLDRLTGDGTRSLVDLLLVLRAAKEDPRVAGIVTRVGSLAVGWAKAQEIRSLLQDFRASGKKLVAYVENEFGNSTLEYFVASAAEEVYVPPAGSLIVNGLLAEYMFLGGVWDKLDVDMEVLKIGDYKTAGDMYANKEMSAAHREMANSLLDSIYGQFISAVADARGLDETSVREIVDRGPITAAELEEAGLIDGTRFLDEIRTELVGVDGELVRQSTYAQNPRAEPVEPVGRVALIFGLGTIMTGNSTEGLVSDELVMGSETMREAFEEAADDEEIDAIVFRVDSPGGSALASDLIWRATQRARSSKPLIVSMSDVAGSGGYYVAAGADRILADPGTLTGSIGVVMAKPNISGLLEKFGVHTETIRRGELAGIVSGTESFSDAEFARVRASMDEVYRIFVDRVATGRSMDAGAVDSVGQGRVWTGEQALENGLVDRLGGLLDAIDEAKQAIGVDSEEKLELVYYPRERGWVERLAEALESRVSVPMPSWWKKVRGAVAAYDFPEGSILTLMPQVVEVR